MKPYNDTDGLEKVTLVSPSWQQRDSKSDRYRFQHHCDQICPAMEHPVLRLTCFRTPAYSQEKTSRDNDGE